VVFNCPHVESFSGREGRQAERSQRKPPAEILSAAKDLRIEMVGLVAIEPHPLRILKSSQEHAIWKKPEWCGGAVLHLPIFVCR
jgi:hypothetical protein